MMKNNDNIICIKDYYSYSYNASKYIKAFFKYKKYKIQGYVESVVYDSNNDDESGYIEKSFRIKNEEGAFIYLSEGNLNRHFITEKEHRKLKLKKITNESR